MKSLFKDPIKPDMKKRSPNPWQFSDLTYDHRCGTYVQAGSNYGTGFKQPVGSKTPKRESNVPKGIKDVNYELDEL